MMPQAIGFGLGTLLSVANLLIPLAILTFAVGFFPYKPFLPGLAQYDETGDHEAPPVAPFDKVVFMVVDALRRCVSIARIPSRKLTSIATLSIPTIPAFSSRSGKIRVVFKWTCAESDQAHQR